MFNFDALKKTVSALKDFNTEAEVTKIVEDNKGKLTELQKEQLAAGVDISGNPRVDEYRPLTKYIKRTRGKGLGAVTDRVTFFMEGNLYNSLHTVVKDGKFETLSDRFTFQKMIERVGDENYGLDPESRKEFATTVTVPEFRKVLAQKTGFK